MSNTSKVSLAEFKNTDSKIRKIKRLDELQTFKVFPRSSLRLHVLGNMSTFYIDHYVNGNQKRVPLGSWKDPDTNNGGELTVDEVIELGAELKKWCKANNGTPDQFFNSRSLAIISEGKTLSGVCWEWFEEVYKPNKKFTTFNDRRKKLLQMITYFGDDMPIKQLELSNSGRQQIKQMLESLWCNNGHHYTAGRNRGILHNVFAYAEDEGYIGTDENPASKFHWEGKKHKIKKFANGATGNPSLAPEILDGKWGRVPEFITSINQCSHKDTGLIKPTSRVLELAVRLHFLMCIRTGVIVRLQWDWFDEDENLWVIPATTTGLKRQLDSKDDHHIPSTPEIKKVIDELKVMNGWSKYVCYSIDGGNYDHLHPESIGDFITDKLGWAEVQNAHGWRSVIATGGKEFWDKKDLTPQKRDYIIRQQLGHLDHKNRTGAFGAYDYSTYLPERREFMNWWSKTLVNELGLNIEQKEQN